MKEKISIEILDKHYDKIKEMLGSFIYVYDKDYDFILISESKKNWIINHAISYTIAIEYDEYDVHSFDECFISAEINDKEPYSIPEAFRNNLLQLINEIIEDFKALEKSEIFEVSSNKYLGRMDLLWKSIIFQIKLLEKRQVNFHKKIPIEIKDTFKPLDISLKKEVQLYYDSIINQSIQFSLCYEDNPKDYKMCREILLHDASNSNNYKYRLEKDVNKIMKNNVNIFLDTYLNKKTDKDFKKDSEIILTLTHTLNIIKKSIEEIYQYKDYQNNPLCDIVYDEYQKVFSNFKTKIKNSSMRPKLILAIEKSNMNYILQHDGKYIYPFIYDLLVIRFSMLLKTALYNEQLNKSHLLPKEINENKYKFYDKDSNENYLFKELIRLAEELPEEYKNKDHIDKKYMKTNFDKFSKFPTRLIVKHYSQILKVDYKSVAIVASRLIFDMGEYNSTYFYLSKDIKSKPLTIDSDYFRALSLNII